MNQGWRLLFFLTTILVSVGLIVFWPPDLVVSPAVKVILFASLITASFSAVLIEHFFTKPTDVVANGTAALLLLLPAKPELANLGWIFWAITVYYIIAIAIASASILIFSLASPDSEKAQWLSRGLRATAIRFGNFKMIYGSAFFATLFLYVQNTSTTFLVLAVYFLAVLIIEPNRSLRFLLTAWKKDDSVAIGDVISVQARNVFLAKLRPNRTPLTRFRSVSFKYKLDGTRRTCLIIDSYLLNEEQWVKMLPIDEACPIPEDAEPNVVYHSLKHPTAQIANRIIGVVTEGSSIGSIRFEYSSKEPVSQGKLVEVTVGNKKILYQIVQGTTVQEILERKNKSGGITGEAVQLGVWNTAERRFERYGWVPEINSLILEPSVPDLPQIDAGELEIGKIPGTAYPVLMNVEEAITHHLAVFGVTGSGKSVFTRWLMQQYIARGVLVMCIDNTQEYKKKLPVEAWAPVVPDDKNEDIKKCVSYIAGQMELWPKDRNSARLSEAQEKACQIFGEAVLAVPAGVAGILNLPDLESTIGGLEYIRLFFSAVFNKARAGDFGDRKICIILEEAHTLVPEWNFNSGDEKRTHALVNTIAQIALQGRKYNVGLVVVGQRTANVSKTVLTQCNSVVAFQQFDPTGLEFFSHYMGRNFAEGLSVLPSRRAVAVGKAFAAGVPLIFQVPQIAEQPIVPAPPQQVEAPVQENAAE